MQPTPPNWPRIAAALYYQDPADAIAWLGRAFGFEVRLLLEDDDGNLQYSELGFGGGVIMVRGEQREIAHRRAPSSVGGINTQNLMVYVDDVDAHCQRARAAGARILEEPSTQDYGEDYFTDRGYLCEDCGGHRWWFYQRLRTGG